MSGGDAGRVISVVLLVYLATLLAGLHPLTANAPPAAPAASAPATPPSTDDVLLPGGGS
jgi:hypothetical protein